MPRCPTCGQPVPAQPSPRQRDVLRLLAEGLSTREIGARLSISPKTVETHFAHLRRRAGVTSTRALLAWAFRQGQVAMPAKEEEP